MDMIRTLAVMILAIAMVSISVAQIGSASAHPHNNSTTQISLGDGTAIERTQITFNIPSDNVQPWAFVEGIVENPVKGYPVIIQIHNSNAEPMKFAQVDLAGDGTYEYRFRVSSLDEGNSVSIFEGDYDVTIYTVVHVDQQLEYV